MMPYRPLESIVDRLGQIMSVASRCGIVGQSVWFAFGLWVGLTLQMLLAILPDKPFTVRGVVDDGSSLPFLVILNAFTGALLTLPFAAWLRFRQSRTHRFELSPFPTLIVAILLMPTLVLITPTLCAIAGQGQGWLIGSLMFSGIFGTPVLVAELCARRAIRNAPSA